MLIYKFAVKKHSSSAMVFLFLIFYIGSFFTLVVDADEWSSYTRERPWALGIVVPDGAPTKGGVVKWDSSSNLTVVLTIPKINMTDSTIYVIVSVMTKSGIIIQAAIGIESDDECWRSYVMYVHDVYTSSKGYVPVLLGGPPSFSPGDSAIISIYSEFIDSIPVWTAKITNLSTQEGQEIRLFSDGSSRFMKGDHEVVALESYTKSEHVFRNMGQLILHDVFVDGQRVLGGWYVSNGQVFMSNLLFEVGAGEPVPSFLYLVTSNNSGAIWGYSNESWEPSPDGSFFLLLGALLLVILLIMFVAVKIR